MVISLDGMPTSRNTIDGYYAALVCYGGIVDDSLQLPPRSVFDRCAIAYSKYQMP